MTRLLVTGANGFVGRALCADLIRHGHQAVGVVRRTGGCVAGTAEWLHAAPDFAGLDQHWPDGAAIDCVIHTAARVHQMRDAAADPLAACRETNLEGSLRVARAARAHGVRRLVYLSSIKALAERDAGTPLTERDVPQPEDAYGISKLEAERALAEFGRSSGLEIVIVRPPLVYGPGVRANFLKLVEAIAKGVPLPLGAIAARRSLLYVENFADALRHCALDPRAANQCFHVTDGEDLSVTELARALGRHLGFRATLVPVPAAWLRLLGRLAGREAQVGRLVDSLRVDAQHLRATLGWQAPHGVDAGLAATAHWYRTVH